MAHTSLGPSQQPALPSAGAKGRRLVPNASRRRRKMIAFGWYGGKYVHLDFILPSLPADAEHYCDVYGGSAAVLINRPPAPVETYNDLDSDLVNFFAVLRDQPDQLVRQIGLTPFSREELAKACRRESDLAPLERARRFYVRARQTRTGLAQTSSEGRWAHCVLTSRAGMAGAVSRWLGAVEGLPEIAQRLQRVQIENAPALEIIQRFDTSRTLFYSIRLTSTAAEVTPPLTGTRCPTTTTANWPRCCGTSRAARCSPATVRRCTTSCLRIGTALTPTRSSATPRRANARSRCG